MEDQFLPIVLSIIPKPYLALQRLSRRRHQKKASIKQTILMANAAHNFVYVKCILLHNSNYDVNLIYKTKQKPLDLSEQNNRQMDRHSLIM